MKHCKEIKPLLVLFAEEELDPKQIEKVQTHLQSCRDCQAELAAIQNLTADLQPAKYTLPVSYSSELIVSLNDKIETTGKSRRKLVPSFSMIAAVIIVIFALVFRTNFQRPEDFLTFDYMIYQTFGGTDMIYDMNETEIAETMTNSLMPETFYNFSREYIIENTSIIKSTNYDEVFADMQDEDFEQIVNRLKSIKL